MTTTSDAPGAARATTDAEFKKTATFIWCMTIGGIAYLAVIVALYLTGESLPPIWLHNSILAAMMIGTVVSCSLLIHRRIARAEQDRQADVAHTGREIQATYDVLARRLRDYGSQISGVREAVAEIRGQDHAVSREVIALRVATASYVGEMAAIRKALDTLSASAPEAEDAAYRRGLIAGAQNPGEVVSIKGRIGSQNSRI